MSLSTEVVTVPKESALQVFSAEQGLDPYLAKIRQEIDGFIPDVTTVKGRKEIASIAYKVAQSKTALDAVGKELVAELKAVPAKVDAERKRMRDLLDAWKDEVRQPLTDWENAEAARVARHQGNIDMMALRIECRDLDVSELKANIATIEGVGIGADWDEFEAEAARTKDKALTALRDALVIREKHEAELAAIAKFQAEQSVREQKEREERIAREAVEQAQREAEAKAQAYRENVAREAAEAEAAAKRREAELIEQAAKQQRQADQDKRDAESAAEQSRLNAELAEQRRIAAEKQAELDKIAADQRAAQERADAVRRQSEAVERAEQSERQRQADDQARIEAEAKLREADRAHKGSILKAAKEAILQTGVTEDQAKAIVKLIAAGSVPNVAISY